MALSQRRFGVELEHGNNRGLNHRRVLEEMSRCKFKTTGVPPTCYSSTWDGSGVEIRTPALKGAKGLKELEKAIRFLVNIGGYVAANDGMHVHHESPEFVENYDAIQALAHTWIDNLSHIHKFVHRRRYGDYAYNRAINKGGIDSNCKRKGDYWPRGDLNFGPLRYKGTIEIRLHEGTLNPATAKSWVVFGQALIDKVSKEGYFGNRKTPDKLLEHLGIADTYSKVLMQRVKGTHVRGNNGG